MKSDHWRLRGFFNHVVIMALSMSTLHVLRADIPWPEVTRRVTEENQKLGSRPQGHAGEYFVVCTLYYTPMESGFTAERGFDATPVTKSGLHGRKYPRDFLRSVMKEGYGRITVPVNGRHYLCYLRGSYGYSDAPSGGGGTLVRRYSAASRRGSIRGKVVQTSSPTLKDVFGSDRWHIIDTGGGLRRWQIDCYWGEDQPMGPGKLMARPRGTQFEYAYSVARVISN